MKTLINKLRYARNEEDGFTVLEMLIVVVIIGILSAIVIPIHAESVRKAERAVTMEELRGAVDGINQLWNPDEGYPISTEQKFQKDTIVSIYGDGEFVKMENGVETVSPGISHGSAPVAEGFNGGARASAVNNTYMSSYCIQAVRTDVDVSLYYASDQAAVLDGKCPVTSP